VKAGGRDDVSKTHIVWKKSLRSYVPSPVLAGDHIVSVNNEGGVLTGLSTKTGEQAFQQRLSNAGGVYASPVVIDGKLYVVTRRSGTFVVGLSGSQATVIAENKFDDDTDFNASPAVTDGKLLLRSNRSLYCIANKSK
jgi:outer membrane protein assembly factor BamB